MRILITDKIDKEGVDLLGENFEVDLREGLGEDDVVSVIKGYDGIIVRSATRVTERVIESGNLKFIGRAGTGVDNIDLRAATGKGVPVINAPMGNVNAVAELAVSMMLALSRDLHNADRKLKNGEWDKKKGTELSGKTLGIIGLGRIGFEVARKAKALGMDVIAYDPYAREGLAESIGVDMAGMTELLTSSDYISVHVPLMPQTENMLGREQFEVMKDGVIIINCARGGIVNEEDLYHVLKSGKVGGAGLDSYSSEPQKPYEKEPSSRLLELENVVLTPHIGASTREAQKRVGIEMAKNIIAFVEEGKTDFVVNKDVLNEKE